MRTTIRTIWVHIIRGVHTTITHFWRDDEHLPTPGGGSTYSPLHLFTMLVSVAALCVYPMAYYRVDMSELGDRQLVIASFVSVALTFVLLHVFAPFFRRITSKLLPKIILLLLVVGYVGLGFREEMYETDFRGFGSPILLISLLLVLLRSILWGTWSGVFVKTLAEITSIAVVVMGVYVVGMDDSLTDNFYILNQMAVPFTSLSAYATFIPQYTNFYQYFFMLLQWVGVTTQPQLTLYIMYLFLQLLTCITIIMAIYVVYGVMPRRSRVYAILYVVPLFFISTYPWWSSEPRYYPIQLFVYTLIPIRMFAIFGVGSICIWMFYKYQHHLVVIAIGGIVAGIAAYNSNDFGVAATVGVGAMLVFQPFAKWQRWMVQVIVFICSTVVCVAGLFAINNSYAPINSDYMFWFQRKFSSGFGSMLIQFPGNGLMVIMSVFAVWMCALALFFTLRRHYFIYQRDLSIPLHFASLMYISTVSIFGLSYYINRSVMSFQGSSMYICLFISLYILIQLYYRITPHSSQYRTVRYSNLAGYIMGIVPITIALCHTPLYYRFSPNELTFVQMRNYDSITNAWTPQYDELHIEHLTTVTTNLKQTQLHVAYAGPFANLVQLYADIPAASIFDHPANIEVGSDALELYCQQLEIQPYDVFITDQGYGCPNLILAKSPSLGTLFYYRRNLEVTQPEAWQKLMNIAAPCIISPANMLPICEN